MFEALVSTLSAQDSLLLLRTWKKSILRLMSSKHQQQAGVEAEGGGYWQYWALIPPTPLSPSSKIRSIERECAVLIRLCDEESFLVDAYPASEIDSPAHSTSTLPALGGLGDQHATDEETATEIEDRQQEYASYMQTCVRQMGNMDTYNPLAFPSGRYTQENLFDLMGPPTAPVTASSSVGSAVVSNKSLSSLSNAPRGTLPVQDPPSGQAQRQGPRAKSGSNPRSTGTLPITTTPVASGIGTTASFASALTRVPHSGRRGDSSGARRQALSVPSPPSKNKASHVPSPYENYRPVASSTTAPSSSSVSSDALHGGGKKRPVEELLGSMQFESEEVKVRYGRRRETVGRGQHQTNRASTIQSAANVVS